MKTLAVYDRKDYDPSLPRNVDNSSRAIIIVDNKIAMIYVKKYDFYCFPGGRHEEGETRVDALIRETREETGLIIKPESVKAFGMIKVVRKDIKAEGIYEKHEFYYTCEVEDTILQPSLTQSEINSGYQLQFVTFEEAIEKNELELQIGKKYTEAETFVLKLLNVSKPSI